LLAERNGAALDKRGALNFNMAQSKNPAEGSAGFEDQGAVNGAPVYSDQLQTSMRR
jgi:hypothetical protein